ncbi:hypothetical protein BACUNI_01059 [Bacteroides uniformis ATCC 8492]|uniref:Uncharacterized protein n=1 Tax=Bacteroides uniformis (strain ATCC 8492 / DSM 6597 / CCUG 4942 / CIP 103695 / JCM 5828 / KCTC 5204 / NCTC 13054 / VPI 0061) TaxID=411479 RepID=A0ABC9NF92_BACUC|nr:hypothetical protein BACUNI_01059 [Bacteroides uniformis ATCC 8492]
MQTEKAKVGCTSASSSKLASTFCLHNLRIGKTKN